MAYDGLLANTHLLSATAAESLKALLAAGAGCTIDELGQSLFGGTGVDTGAELLSPDERAALEAIVAGLQQLGLVATRPS